MALFVPFEIGIIIWLILIWVIPWNMKITRTLSFTRFQWFLSGFVLLLSIFLPLALLSLIIAGYFLYKHLKERKLILS